MSLTRDTKEELSITSTDGQTQERLEALVIVRLAGEIVRQGGMVSMKVSLDSEESGLRLQAQIRRQFGIKSRLVEIVNSNLRNATRYLVEFPVPNLAFLDASGFIGRDGKQIRGLPGELVNVTRKNAFAVLRGAFIARGTLNGLNRVPVIEISTPNLFIAIALSGVAKRIDIITKAQSIKDYAKVVIRDPDMISKFLEVCGANDTKKKFDSDKEMYKLRISLNRKQNFDTANIKRSVDAAVLTVQKLKIALNLLNDELPEHLQKLADLRMRDIELSLEDLGARMVPPITKDAVAGRFRRIWQLADAKAAEMGVPGPSSVKSDVK
ncbi:MAG: DNA-binding protein WhiA [Bifidobacteriaceae bacterium]|jgi:DNA-binding protein WhiA|nr:DNA-binding protein WhiA [Bifidobacteriaceae bacterium]